MNAPMQPQIIEVLEIKDMVGKKSGFKYRVAQVLNTCQAVLSTYAETTAVPWSLTLADSLQVGGSIALLWAFAWTTHAPRHARKRARLA